MHILHLHRHHILLKVRLNMHPLDPVIYQKPKGYLFHQLDVRIRRGMVLRVDRCIRTVLPCKTRSKQRFQRQQLQSHHYLVAHHVPTSTSGMSPYIRLKKKKIKRLASTNGNTDGS